METTILPGTELEVSRIGLGTWAIGGWMWGGSDEQQAVATIQAAVDRGITLIDTAPVYGAGRSEEIVGRAVAGARRERVVLATKCGLVYESDGITRDSSPARIEREVEASLRRLGTDRIDLYQVHWPDGAVPFEDTAAAMERLRRRGLIRAVGVSNFTPQQMAAFRRGGPLHSDQPPYNLFERGIEADVLPYCREHEIGVLGYGALCRGLLSGKVTADGTYPEGDLRRSDPKFQPGRREQYLAAVGRLDELAQERWGRRVLHLAVRWMLDQPGLTAALWGARRPEQLEPLDGVWDFTVDQAAMTEIDRILDECIADPVGPEFMAPPERTA